MIKLIHHDGTVSDLSFLRDKEFAVIGSSSRCTVRIAEKGIAPKHCRIINTQALYYVQMISKKAPIYINETLMQNKEVLLSDEDNIRLGSWTMQFSNPSRELTILKYKKSTKHQKQTQKNVFISKLHTLLLQKMDLKGLDHSLGKKRIELSTRAQALINEILDEFDAEVKELGMDRADLYQEVIDDILGYGPLADLLRDDSVAEIMCVGGEKIYVERKGKLELTDKTFMGDDHLKAIIERIVSPIGRRIDESSPIVDARLPDGSRVNAVINPVALDGPSLNIRKFSSHPLKIEDLIEFGALTEKMGKFLKLAVEYRKNMIICGGTGSGKTTLLDVVSSFIPSTERIVTIEDSAELRLEQSHVVRLESRPSNIEGKGQIAIRDLVRNALRMRPDRIIVGECRGSEALDMLQAMNTGHDGSLTTLHSNSSSDAISRLETMVLMAGMDLPIKAIRTQIGSAVHVVCHQSRLTDGARKIMAISEVIMEEDQQEGSITITLQDIYRFEQTDIDGEGNIIGSFRPTGMIPVFVTELRERGIEVDMSIFVMDKKG